MRFAKNESRHQRHVAPSTKHILRTGVTSLCERTNMAKTIVQMCADQSLFMPLLLPGSNKIYVLKDYKNQ